MISRGSHTSTSDCGIDIKTTAFGYSFSFPLGIPVSWSQIESCPDQSQQVSSTIRLLMNILVIEILAVFWKSLRSSHVIWAVPGLRQIDFLKLSFTFQCRQKQCPPAVKRTSVIASQAQRRQASVMPLVVLKCQCHPTKVANRTHLHRVVTAFLDGYPSSVDCRRRDRSDGESYHCTPSTSWGRNVLDGAERDSVRRWSLFAPDFTTGRLFSS